MAETVPIGLGPREFRPVGPQTTFAPTGQPFREPQYNIPVPPPLQHPPFPRYNNDLAGVEAKLSQLDLEEGDIRQKPRRSSKSPKRRNSVRRRSSSTGRAANMYEFWQFEKTGDDWTQATRYSIVASQNDLENKVLRYRDSITDKLGKMKPARRNHITTLLEDRNKEERESGATWQAVYIVDRDVIVNKARSSKDVRRMDVITKRGFPSQRPAQSKTRQDSVVGQKIDLKKTGKSEDKNKDKKDSSKPVKDPDPFGVKKLFSPDGKPLDEHGNPIDDTGGLPAHILPDQPIGAPLRNKSMDRGAFGEVHSGNPEGVINVGGDPLAGGALNMQDILYGSGGGAGGDRGRPRDSGVGFDQEPVLPRGSLSRRRSARRAQRSRSRTQSRPRIINPEDAGRYNRLNEFESVSSVDDGRSVIRGDLDEISTNTSDSIHRDYERNRQYERGDRSRRRSSTKYDHPPTYREHYRGPNRYSGEYDLVPVRRYSTSNRPRPASYLQYPLQRAITYTDQTQHDLLTPASPTRRDRPVELIYPTDLREDDRLGRAEGYMNEAVRREQELMDREYMVAARERDIAERERRREKRYFAPPAGGYSSAARYDDGAHVAVRYGRGGFQ